MEARTRCTGLTASASGAYRQFLRSGDPRDSRADREPADEQPRTEGVQARSVDRLSYTITMRPIIPAREAVASTAAHDRAHDASTLAATMARERGRARSGSRARSRKDLPATLNHLVHYREKDHQQRCPSTGRKDHQQHCLQRSGGSRAMSRTSRSCVRRTTRSVSSFPGGTRLNRRCSSSMPPTVS